MLNGGDKMYKPSLTLWKYIKVFIYILLAGSLTYATENPAYMALIPLIEALANYVKHKDD